MTAEHVEQTLIRLMLLSKVRAAVQLLTKWAGGGVLDLHAEAHSKEGPL